MPNPASVADIEARWRPLVGHEVANAEAFLGDAWAEVLRRRKNIEADIAADKVSEENVVRVVVAMVLRVLRNPEGYDQESIDDWSGRRNALVADGILRITDDELDAITPETTGRAGRRHSVRLVVYGDA